VSELQWLIGFHVVGAFLFVSGAVAVGALYALATRREKPSEVAFLLGLTRPAVAVVGAGALLTLSLGAWIVDHEGWDWGDGWISAALLLWIASVVLGAIGGRSARHTRYLAKRLAAEGNGPSQELRRKLADPVPQAMNYGSFLAVVAVLALMIWKPGA
jgi:uncharacterized membrane protein